MKLITEDGEKYLLVSNQSNVEEIVNRINEREPFAHQFKFSEEKLFCELLESIKVNYEDFSTQYFYYDGKHKLHISQSEFGYVWISNMGLVPNKRASENRAVNSCLTQYTVISLLLDKAIEVINDERVYDIDSRSFGHLSKLSPAIYQNFIFYIEVFCKAYLSITGIPPRPKPTHKLSSIYQETIDVMTNQNHNDSLFQVLVLDPLYQFVEHIHKIPGVFKEQYIKYDDNLQDDTVILFDVSALNEMKSLLELSSDFIEDYFYLGTDTHYLKTNLYQRLLEKADTEEKKKRVKDLYPHLEKADTNILKGGSIS